MRVKQLAGIGLLTTLLAVPSAAALGARADDASLADALQRGDVTAARGLLADGAEVNVPQVDGMTALHWAVYHDDTGMVQLLLEAGGHVEAANRYGVRPLWVAVTNGSSPVVTLLLDAGADPNATARGGRLARVACRWCGPCWGEAPTRTRSRCVARRH